MKIFKSIGITLLALCMPAMAQGHITIQEAKTLIKEGKAKKLPEKMNSFYESNSDASRLSQAADAPVGQFNAKGDDSNSGAITPKKVPAKVTSGGSEVYGYVIYSEDETVMPIGLYSIEPNSLHQEWEDEFYYTEFYGLRSGFLYNGTLVGVGIYSFMGYMFAYSRLQIDFETGRLLNRTDYDYTNPEVITYETIAYNTNDGCVYGTALADDKNYHWYRTTVDDFSTGDDLGITSPDISGLCYNELENAFFGLDIYGNFIKVDLDGTCTTLFALEAGDLNFNSLNSLVYCPIEKLYYTNLRSKTNGYILAIDPEKKKFVSKDQMPKRVQFSIMVTTDEVEENPMKPVAPKISQLSFEDGSTTGFGDFIMPAVSVTDQPLTGELRAFPTVNGYAVGPEEGYVSAAGETVRVEYSDLPEGRNTFKMFVRYNGIASRTATETVFLGNDVPLAPKNVQINDSLVKWSAVRKGVNDAFLARNELVYRVYVNEEFIGETDKTKIEYRIPQDKEYALYTAKVIAVCRGKESEPAYSTGYACGVPYNLPINIVPTEEQSYLCNITNVNMDEAMWWFNDFYDAFVIGYNSYKDNNDWVVMPPFVVPDTTKYYQLSFEVARASQKYTEEFISVYAGDSPSPESMTSQLMAPLAPLNYGTTYDKYYLPFKVDNETGCYVGFHCTSAADQYGMRLKNINIVDNNITDLSPAQVLNLDLQPYDSGELKADISFNLPRKTLFGEQLPKDATITACIMGVDTIQLSGRPGERVKAVINTHQGNNIITIMTKMGELGSLDLQTSVVTGVMQPTTPVITGLTIAPDMQSMTMTWNPVTTGMEGGYVDPSDITYTVYKHGYTPLGAEEWKELANTGKTTNYTYVCEPGDPLDVVLLGVASFNAAGTNGYVAGGQGQVGTPYTLPMEDEFSNGYFNLNPWLTTTPNATYTAEYATMETVEVGNFDTRATYVMVGQGEQGSKGRLAVPRFTSMDLQGAKMTINVYTGAKAAPMTIYAGYQGAQKLLKMGEIAADPNGPDFTTLSFDVPDDAMGHYWVQIYIDSDFQADDQLFMMQSIQVTSTSGVEVLGDETLSIAGGQGYISVAGCNGSEVSVSSLDGISIVNEKVGSDYVEYPVSKGVYVVKAGCKTVKVAVK